MPKRILFPLVEQRKFIYFLLAKIRRKKNGELIISSYIDLTTTTTTTTRPVGLRTFVATPRVYVRTYRRACVPRFALPMKSKTLADVRESTNVLRTTMQTKNIYFSFKVIVFFLFFFKKTQYYKRKKCLLVQN